MNLYMRAIELERRLAEALGHEVAFVAEASGTVWIRNEDGSKSWLPSPARDVADNLNLMLQVGAWPRETVVNGAPVFEVVDSGGFILHREPIPADGNKKSVLLLAVVAGAINLLVDKKH